MSRLPFEEWEELEKLIEAYASGCHMEDGDEHSVGEGGKEGRDDEQHGHCNHDVRQREDDICNVANGEDDDEGEFVEQDPSERYGRYGRLLGKGAVKKVYRGFDKETGMEVAWNQASLNALDHIESEIRFLHALNHDNIIKIYMFWVDEQKHKVNFITELCTDNLLSFRRQHRHVCMKAVRDWARQILKALVYLHSQNPPVIHRDMKCENIFVNSSDGKIKVGDFGSATLLDEETHHLHALIGTPEFVAPEMFMEDYNELVDIYAFGMCMIELLSLETPYKECHSILQVYKAVTNGVAPMALHKIADAEAVRFIRKCLAPVSCRPSAAELLSDPFLQLYEEHTNPSLFYKHPFFRSASFPHLHPVSSFSRNQKLTNVDEKTLCSHASFGECRNRKALEVTGEWKNESKLLITLRITHSNGPLAISNVNFPFDSNSDTPESVAEEMVQELDFPASDSTVIADLIASVINSLKEEREKQLSGEASSLKFGCQYLRAVA